MKAASQADFMSELCKGKVGLKTRPSLVCLVCHLCARLRSVCLYEAICICQAEGGWKQAVELPLRKDLLAALAEATATNK